MDAPPKLWYKLAIQCYPDRGTRLQTCYLLPVATTSTHSHSANNQEDSESRRRSSTAYRAVPELGGMLGSTLGGMLGSMLGGTLGGMLAMYLATDFRQSTGEYLVLLDK